MAYPPTPAETGLTIADQTYEPGNLFRYGVVPNSTTPATVAANTAALKALANPSGHYTGRIYSPDYSGGYLSTPPTPTDVYYFNDMVQFHDGVQVDLCGTTWNFTKTGVTSDSNNSFIFAMRDFVIENGTIAVVYAIASGATNAGNAMGFGGRDVPVPGSPLPTIFDSLLSSPMGGFTVRNVKIQMTVTGGSNSCVLMLGGLRDGLFENVQVDGGGVSSGLEYEFGFATNETVTSARQSSHMHNFIFRNVRATNLAGNGTAIDLGGAYNVVIDGLYVKGVIQAVAMRAGEAQFFRPWAGVDDIGVKRNIVIRNVIAESVSGTGVQLQGSDPPTQASGYLMYPWQASQAVVVGQTVTNAINWAPSAAYTVGTVIRNAPAWTGSTAYILGAVVKNGVLFYTCVQAGTSAASGGPTGTGSGIVDGSVKWNNTAGLSYVCAVAGTSAASGGPTGTGSANIVDGTVTWIFASAGFFPTCDVYVCTAAGTTAASVGPTGTGSSIVDGGAIWAYVPPAKWCDHFDAIIENVSMLGTVGGFGVYFTGRKLMMRGGDLTGFQRGVVTATDTTQWDISEVNITNCSSFGMEIPLGVSCYAPARFSNGSISNCFIAGNAVTGIAMSQVGSCLISRNRLGYEIVHDSINEATQTSGVNLSSSCFNVTCDGNWVNTPGGAAAYVQTGATKFQGCVVRHPGGQALGVSGNWEGILTDKTIALTCQTPGNLAVAYSVNNLDYIILDGKVECHFEIVTSSFSYSTASGNLLITGLPVPCNSTVPLSVPTGPIDIQGITKTGYTNFTCTGSGGSTNISLSAAGSGQAAVTVKITDLPTGGSIKIFGSLSYFA